MKRKCLISYDKNTFVYYYYKFQNNPMPKNALKQGISLAQSVFAPKQCNDPGVSHLCGRCKLLDFSPVVNVEELNKWIF